MVLLSIIIPHYNSVQSLTTLLNTIPIRNDLQIIVVDDNSTKGTSNLRNLIKEYQHVQFIKKEKEEKGAGSSRNIGLRKAIGKWVLFADADDFFMKNFYKKISKYFYTDYDVIFFRPTSIELDTRRKSDRHSHFESLILNYIDQRDLKNELLLRYSFSVPWSKMIKRSFLTEHGIKFDEVIASNDVMFSTELGHKMKNFFVSKDIIYCVTKGKGSLTNQTSIEVYDARVEVFIRYYQYLRNVLNRQSWEILNLNSTLLLLQAVKFKLGFRTILKTCIRLKKNKVKIVDKRLLNPLFLYKKGVKQYKKFKNQKKYLT